MSDFILSCSSTVDLTNEYMESRDIRYICFTYALDGVEYPHDFGKTMPVSEFYEKMKNGAEPTTSQVNVSRYTEYFEKLAQEGKPILHIDFSSGMSGSYNCALLAKQEVKEKYPDSNIYVLDSLGGATGQGMYVSILADRRDEGMKLEDLIEYAERLKHKIHYWFFATDLKNFIRGGRISPASGWVGTILKICPLLRLNEKGVIVPTEKCRGKAKAMSALVERMEKYADGGYNYNNKCFISHAACSDDADAVIGMIEEKFPNLKGKIEKYDIGPIIGSHTGPGAIGLFFVGSDRT